MGAQQKTHRVLGAGGLGEARMTAVRGVEPVAANPESESPSACDRLMEEICERENLKQALKRVKANKGAPGVDGMTVHALPAYPCNYPYFSASSKPSRISVSLTNLRQTTILPGGGSLALGPNSHPVGQV